MAASIMKVSSHTSLPRVPRDERGGTVWAGWVCRAEPIQELEDMATR